MLSDNVSSLYKTGNYKKLKANFYEAENLIQSGGLVLLKFKGKIMMKRSVMALAVTLSIMPTLSNAAEI